MANKVVIFPVGKEASAAAYAAWTDQHSPFLPHDPGSWAYQRPDIFGQTVVPFLGPPFAYGGVEFAEPAGGAAMRADGVLHDSAVWPPPEE